MLEEPRRWIRPRRLWDEDEEGEAGADEEVEEERTHRLAELDRAQLRLAKSLSRLASRLRG